MKIRCGNCRKKYDIPERHIGKKFKCLKCGSRIQTDFPDVGDGPAEAIHEVATVGSRPEATSMRGTETELAARSSAIPDLSAMRPARTSAFGNSERASNLAAIVIPAAAIVVAGLCVWLISGYLNPGNAPDDDNASAPAAAVESDLPGAGNGNPVERRFDTFETVDRAGASGSQTRQSSAPGNNGFRNDLRFVSSNRPVISADPPVDPTFVNYDKAGFERYFYNDLLLEYALSYGGADFQDVYQRSMNSDRAATRMDGAIGAANWGHDLEQAIPVMLGCVKENDVTADGKARRLHYAYRLLNAYPEQVDIAFRDIISSGNDGFDVCLEKLIETNRVTPDVFRSIVSGAMHAELSPSSDNRLERTLDSFMGYSRIDPAFLGQVLNTAPSNRHLPIPLRGRVRQVTWIDSGGKVSTAEQTGLNFIPDTFDEITYLRVSDILQCGAMSFKFGPNSFKISVEERLQPLADLVRSIGCATQDVEFVTVGRPSKIESATEATMPTLMIVRLSTVPNQNGLVEAGKETGDGLYRLPSGYSAAFIDERTLAVGTVNELLWCRDRRRTDHIHPAVYHWPELEYCDAFEGDNDDGSFFQFDLRTADVAVTTFTEYFIDLETTLSREEWQQHVSQLANARLEHERSQSVKEEELRRALAEQTERSPEEYPDQRTIDAMSSTRLFQEMSGTRLAREVQGHHLFVLGGRGFAMMDPMDFNDDVLGLRGSPAELPDEDDEIEDYINVLAGSVSPDTAEYRQFLKEFLNAVIRRIEESPEPVTDVQAMRTLEATYRVSGLFSREHVEQIKQIANAIEFRDGPVARSRWAIACLSGIHDPQAIMTIAGFLLHDDGFEVLNTSNLIDEEDDIDIRNARSDNYQLQRQLTREAVEGDGDQPTDLHRRVALYDRTLEVCDRLGPIMDYYMRYGDADVRSACLEIIARVPRIKKGLAYRTMMLRHEHDSTGEQQLRIDQLFPRLPLEFEVPEISADERRNMGSTVPFYSSVELPVSGEPAEIVGLELFAPASAPFSVRLLKTARAEDSVLDFSGSLHHIPPNENESPQDWSARVENVIAEKDPANYRLLDGLWLKIEGSDAIRVETHVYEVDEISRHWANSCDMLGADLVSERAGDSGAHFDRIRYFFVNGVPKAQRVIAWRARDDEDYYRKVSVRWIGRNRQNHPDYVDDIMDSLELDRNHTSVPR